MRHAWPLHNRREEKQPFGARDPVFWSAAANFNFGVAFGSVLVVRVRAPEKKRTMTNILTPSSCYPTFSNREQLRRPPIGPSIQCIPRQLIHCPFDHIIAPCSFSLTPVRRCCYTLPHLTTSELIFSMVYLPPVDTCTTATLGCPCVTQKLYPKTLCLLSACN